MTTWEEEKERFFLRIMAMRSDKTAKNYRKHLGKFEEFWEEVKRAPLPDPSTITPDEFAEFVIWLRSRYQPNYTNKIVSNMVRFLTFSRNPHIFELQEMIPKRELKPRDYYTTEELKMLLSLFDERKGFKEFMLKVMVWTHAMTGLRHFEVVNLTWSNIRIEDSLITLRGKMGKWRRVYIPTPLRDLLARYLKTWNAYMAWVQSMGFRTTTKLFFRVTATGEPAEPSERYFYNIVELRARKLGISFNWKKFRTTWAKLLHDAGAPTDAAAILLGHSDVKTTVQFYHELEVTQVSHYAEEVLKMLERGEEHE